MADDLVPYEELREEAAAYIEAAQNARPEPEHQFTTWSEPFDLYGPGGRRYRGRCRCGFEVSAGDEVGLGQVIGKHCRDSNLESLLEEVDPL